MFDRQRITQMRTILQCALVLVALLLFFTAPSQIAAAGPEPDFIEIYKDYFKDLSAKKYEKVWDVTTVTSKKSIAKAITDAALAKGKATTEAQVYDMLDKNTSNLRTTYFDNFNSILGENSYISKLLAAQYSLKSSTKEQVILTITLNNEPKDFQIIREGGKWKINFFLDLER
ncbi:MAG: hypothetical protein C0399_06130 [Syntrophus sp. (in: bacteria)]|nr:hypothetical protein [Syntrophus sp. (in: bacteria)]